MGKKLKKNEYNWTFQYIKEYNDMVSYYEKQLDDKNKVIENLENKITEFESENRFKIKQKQITDRDIEKIRSLKENGKSYSYISSETGWSKATISRVINNKKGIY